MAYMAQLDENNVVLQVLSVSNNDCPDPAPDNEALGEAFLQSLPDLGGTAVRWKQTSYHNNFRKQYAGIGYTYDAEADVFVAPQPFPSWSLDENHDWQAPVAMPTEGGPYMWDEDTLTWLAVSAG
jgi:hypothetical protein